MSEKIIKDGMINVFENLSVKYKDVVISISGDDGGELDGRTGDQILLFCADLLTQASGENTIENNIDIPMGIRETLIQDFGWTDIDVNEFMKKWRRNIYIKRIGEDNRRPENLKEIKEVMTKLEKKDDPDAGGNEIEEIFNMDKEIDELMKDAEKITKEKNEKKPE
jgi:hypothetical protein